MRFNGIGELTSVTILAELADPAAFQETHGDARPLLRAGHHRPPIRCPPFTWASLPTRPTGVALGAL